MELVLAVPSDLHAPRLVRAALTVLDHVFPPAFVDDVRLLANELVTNAIKHGGLRHPDEVEVWADASDDRVRVEVIGGRHRFFLRSIRPSLDRTSGWGLILVAALSNRWGYRDGMTTTVWFEIDRARRLSTEPLRPELDAPRAGGRSIRPRRGKTRAS